MSDIFKLQYNGRTLAYPGWNGYVSYDKPISFSNLSVTNDGHGSLTASVYSGYQNDTATLTPTPNTHYQFSGYTLDGGGSITNNTYTFGDTDGTAKAWFSAKHYTITTANDGHGTCTCNKTTATGNETATLGNSPATHYQFNNYQITGGSVNGNTLTVTANCTAKATFKAKSYSITLQTDGHGKLTCNASTATGGQTVTLTHTNSSYYRFKNYSITGGSVNGNTLTVTANCTAKANFKTNAFTATGTLYWANNLSGSYQGVKEARPCLKINAYTANDVSQIRKSIQYANYGSSATTRASAVGNTAARGWKFGTSANALYLPANASAVSLHVSGSVTGKHMAPALAFTGDSERAFTAYLLSGQGTTFNSFFPKTAGGTNTKSFNITKTSSTYNNTNGLLLFRISNSNYTTTTTANATAWAYNQTIGLAGNFTATGYAP